MPYDYEREQIFEGYNPVEDGFGYPLPTDGFVEPHPSCTCTAVPPPGALRPDERFAATEGSTICDVCFDRLTA